MGARAWVEASGKRGRVTCARASVREGDVRARAVARA